MENRIRKHIEGIFSAAPNTAKAHEIREEMIVNVIERYHDHLAEGMNEEDAYRAAITGIGDVSGLIDSLRREAAVNGNNTPPPPPPQQHYAPAAPQNERRRGLSTGAIVAIVICSTILLLAIISGIIAVRVTGQLFSGNGLLSNILGFVKSESGLHYTFDGFDYGDDEGFENAYASSGEYAVSPGNIDSIDINWVAGGVKILPAEAGVTDIRFTETASSGISSDYALRYRVSGDKLTIRFCAARVWRLIDWNDLFNANKIPQKQLTLYIPEALLSGSLDALTVNSVSNALEVRNITGINAELFTVSGDIGAYDCAFETLKTESVSGETNIEGCTGQRLRANSVSGKIGAGGGFYEYDLGSVSGSLYADITGAGGGVEAETVSGSVRFKVGGDFGFTVRVDTVSGNFNSGGLPVTIQGEDRYVYGDGAVDVRVDTVSGDITLE